ncbi:hypothetical protein EMCRGX_G013023 [Ephydatia muelleri]
MAAIEKKTNFVTITVHEGARMQFITGGGRCVGVAGEEGHLFSFNTTSGLRSGLDLPAVLCNGEDQVGTYHSGLHRDSSHRVLVTTG